MSINAMHFKLPSRFQLHSFMSAHLVNKRWCTLQLPVFNRKINVHGKQRSLIKTCEGVKEQERAEGKSHEKKQQRMNEHLW